MEIVALIGVLAPIIVEGLKAGRTIATADDLTPEELERIRAESAATHQAFDEYVASRRAARVVKT